MDMMNSISAALQRVTAKPAESKPYRISHLILRNWEGGKGRHLVIAGKPVDEQLGGREGRGVQGGQSSHRRWRVWSDVWALHGAGVESREASITLSCTSRRLASNQVRRLQTDFVLTSTESFSNAGDAIADSNIITEPSSNISLEFETQVASVLGVEVVATISHVEVVASDEAVSSCHQHQQISFLLGILTLLAGTTALNAC